MPTINVNGVDLYYEEHGVGSETIFFAHGLLFSGRMFENQIKALSDRYRCITIDFRGQGKSAVTEDGYDMDTLTKDCIEVMKALDCTACHFAGLSMGGFIGMRIAIRHPDLIKSLMLIETTADPEPKENLPKYKQLAFIARWFGLGLVINRVMPIMFGQKFLKDDSRKDERQHWKDHIVSNHKVGIVNAVYGVLNREGVYDDLDKISTPTLIIVGDQDVATEPKKSHRMNEKISDSKLVIVPGAGHSSTIEEPEVVNAAIMEFLN
jgi:pimeloyl-ACP methyl ester carboxylesterase